MTPDNPGLKLADEIEAFIARNGLHRSATLFLLAHDAGFITDLRKRGRVPEPSTVERIRSAMATYERTGSLPIEPFPRNRRRRHRLWAVVNAVDCPKCGAPKGQPCRQAPLGIPYRGAKDTHRARLDHRMEKMK